MTTPILDFVREYADSDAVRFHMPGHKGQSLLTSNTNTEGQSLLTDNAGMQEQILVADGTKKMDQSLIAKSVVHPGNSSCADRCRTPESLDITEIGGADVLYKASGIIAESENNASKLFATARTKYSTEGSSLSIRAMLYLTALYAKSVGRNPLILAGRNAHHAFMSAAALVDLEVEWLYPREQESLVSCKITAEQLGEHLAGMQEKPTAVYITSPDYLGNISDIAGLAKVCHKQDVLLLVDNAHGAYLQFLEESRHPIALGADMCCDSAHKTLPVLTGGGYLHISLNAPEIFAKQAERAMHLFASTSPSYLILQSLDAANAYLAGNYRESVAEFIAHAESLKKHLQNAGYVLMGDEPLKLTVAPKSYGYGGCELAEILAAEKMICEFADPDFLVLMLSPKLSLKDLQRLEQVLCAVPRKSPITEAPPNLSGAERVCSIREALFANSEERNIQDCLGKILANASIACPPAIPIVVCGERIDEEAIRCFTYYGVEHCSVITE